MLEKQLLIDIDLSIIFKKYSELWAPNLIKRHEFFRVGFDRDLLTEECKEYSVVYKQRGISYIPLLSRRRNLPHIDTKELSEAFSTTVIYISEWEDINIEIITKGKQELVVHVGVENNISMQNVYSKRFSKLYSSYSNSNSNQEIFDIDIIFELLNIPKLNQQNPNKYLIQEAISFEFLGNWK